jgi:hypothetical protein
MVMAGEAVDEVRRSLQRQGANLKGARICGPRKSTATAFPLRHIQIDRKLVEAIFKVRARIMERTGRNEKSTMRG